MNSVLIKGKSTKEAADEIGITAGTLKSWEKEIGDLIVIARDEKGNRQFSEQDINFFKRIKEMKNRFLPMDQIIQELQNLESMNNEKVKNKHLNNSPKDSNLGDSLLFLPKEIAEKIGVSTSLLRKYTEFFSIQTEWTRPNQKGHRRFTEENLKTIQLIHQKLHQEKWTWEQTKVWLESGEEPKRKPDTQKHKVVKKEKQDHQQFASQFQEIKSLLEHQNKALTTVVQLLETNQKNEQTSEIAATIETLHNLPNSLKEEILPIITELKNEIREEVRKEFDATIENTVRSRMKMVFKKMIKEK